MAQSEPPQPPQTYALLQNYPNPFNPLTRISYRLAGNGAVVSLKIFDLTGRTVRTLVRLRSRPGSTV